jgi:hypothetical protein
MNLTAFARVFIVFCFVLSAALNVKLYLDNRIMIKLLITADNGLDNANEVRELVDDLHILNRMDLNISKKDDK